MRSGWEETVELAVVMRRNAWRLDLQAGRLHHKHVHHKHVHHKHVDRKRLHHKPAAERFTAGRRNALLRWASQPH